MATKSLHHRLLHPRWLSRLELPRLDLITLAVAGLGAGALLTVAPLLPAPGAASPAFLAAALGCWSWLLLRLARLRAADAGPRAWLGVATGVTLFRGWLIALVAGHLPLSPLAGGGALAVAIVYSVAAALDGVDGRLARGRGGVTRTGAELDVSTDALGLLVVSLVGVRAGSLPPWYLALGLAYPIFRLALMARAAWDLPTHRERLRPNPRARFFAGVQMAVAATALYPVVPRWLAWPAASIAMLPTLWLFVGEWRLVTAATAPGDQPRAR